MQLSAAGLAFIKQSEGFRQFTYVDSAGYPTIGYGHKLLHAEMFPDGVDDEQATALLEADVATAENAVRGLVKVPLSQGQYDALVDFTFNLGEGRLAGSTLLAELNQGRYSDAGLQLPLWDHAGGVVLEGLKQRRLGELGMWDTPDPAVATEPTAEPSPAV